MSEPFIAEIVMFGGNFAPRGWAFCDGQLLPINQFSAVFSLLGTIYGGDGRTTLGLPDMRGRMPIGPRNGPGLTPHRLGDKGGRETVTLNQQNMPSHSHTATTTIHADELAGDVLVPSGNMLAESNANNMYATAVNSKVNLNAAAATKTVSPSGDNMSFNIQNPYIAINFIIALQGTFPSRS